VTRARGLASILAPPPNSGVRRHLGHTSRASVHERRSSGPLRGSAWPPGRARPTLRVIDGRFAKQRRPSLGGTGQAQPVHPAYRQRPEREPEPETNAVDRMFVRAVRRCRTIEIWPVTTSSPPPTLCPRPPRGSRPDPPRSRCALNAPTREGAFSSGHQPPTT
jgi:hypothetical protein